MITIYTTSWCPSCIAAKRFFDKKGQKYEEINIEKEGLSRTALYDLTGGWTVPQIIINGESIGGYDDLLRKDTIGDLEYS